MSGWVTQREVVNLLGTHQSLIGTLIAGGALLVLGSPPARPQNEPRISIAPMIPSASAG